MTPEQKSRQHIDRQLEQAGWIVQDYRQMNISAGLGIAAREFPLKTGEADYMLYADAKAIGVVEAKPKGHTLTGVETQSGKYLAGLPNHRLKDGSLEDSDDLPTPDVLAQEIGDDLQTALEQFTAIAEKVKA